MLAHCLSIPCILLSAHLKSFPAPKGDLGMSSESQSGKAGGGVRLVTSRVEGGSYNLNLQLPKAQPWATSTYSARCTKRGGAHTHPGPMRQARPDVEFQATSKVLLQLLPQGLLGREIDDFGANEGRFQQGSWKDKGGLRPKLSGPWEAEQPQERVLQARGQDLNSRPGLLLTGKEALSLF